MTEKVRTTIYINKAVLEMAQNAAREKAVQTKSQVSTSQFIEDAIRNSVDLVILEGLGKPIDVVPEEPVERSLSPQEELDLERGAKDTPKKEKIKKVRAESSGGISVEDEEMLKGTMAKKRAELKEAIADRFKVPFNPQLKKGSK
jgi:hypothetical protein